jgi:polysaccharide biosynthesis/export protein
MRYTNIAPLALLAALAASSVPLGAQDAGPAPTRLRSAPAATANGSYVVGPEDVIEVFVWKEPELSTTVTIRPDGMITLPLAGDLEASGTTPAELADQIADRLKQYMDRPLVTVVVKQINSPKISVLGEVRRPGRYLLLQTTSVLDAIAMGGGFTEFASRNEVVVLRPGPNGQQQRYLVNVKRMVNDNGKRLFQLRPGDVVYAY